MRAQFALLCRLLAPLTVLGLAACSGKPTVQGPSVVADPPQIVCPSVPPQPSSTGLPVSVSYQPTVTLGAEPVTTSCNPVSGSTFPVGTTPVTCTATDVQRRTSTCTFNVVVQQPPRIGVTRFVAFGDSVTWGEDGALTLTGALRDFMSLGIQGVRLSGREYPTVLQQLLSARFTTQPILVVNAGNPGEFAGGAGTFSRFTGITSSRQYEVVLIMEGTNDIFGGTGGNPLGIPPAIANLRRMVGDARSRGMRVFLATVPPANPAGPRGAQRYQAIPSINAEIRQLAVAEGVPLVDVFNAFNNNFTYLSQDGTHPNAEGYALIASTFYDVIRRELEARTLAGWPAGNASSPFAVPAGDAHLR